METEFENIMEHMKKILLDCGQSEYVLISVPEHIAANARFYQKKFDKWLMDKSNPHGYWIEDEDGELCLSYDPPVAFVKWLNNFVLDSTDNASIVKRDLPRMPDADIPLLHF